MRQYEVLLRLLVWRDRPMRGMSERTVRREWAKARLLLNRALKGDGNAADPLGLWGCPSKPVWPTRNDDSGRTEFTVFCTA